MSHTLSKFFPFLIVLFAGLSYANALNGPLLFDDYYSVESNESIRSISSDTFFAIPPSSPTTRRPLVNLSLAINYQISGLNTWSYHLTNVLVHILAALSLYGTVKWSFRLLNKNQPLYELGETIAFLVASLWVVHPLQTGAVTYINTRTSSFVGLFFLFTFFAYLRWVNGGRTKWRYLSVVTCILGMLCRETMVMVPILIVFFDRAFVSGSFAQSFKERGRYFVSLFATWLALVFAMFSSKGWGYVLMAKDKEVEFLYQGLNVVNNFFTKAGVLLHYLRLVLWPEPLNAHYKQWPIAETLIECWWQLLIVLTLVGLSFWKMKKSPRMSFVGIAFFSILGPSTLLVMPLQLVAEHYMYLPSALVLLVLVILLLKLFQLKVGQTAALRKALIVVGLPLVLLYGCMTHQRNKIYDSEVLFWGSVVAVEEGNFRAHNALANAYLLEGHGIKAREHYQRAIELRGDWSEPYIGMANLLLQVSNDKEAAIYFHKATTLRPQGARGFVGLGHIASKQKKYKQAEELYRKALKEGFFSGVLYHKLAVALVFQKRYEESLEYFKKSELTESDSYELYLFWAGALHYLKRYPEAEQHYVASLNLNPFHLQTVTNLATLYLDAKNMKAAKALLNKSAELAQKENKSDFLKKLGEWQGRYLSQR